MFMWVSAGRAEVRSGWRSHQTPRLRMEEEERQKEQRGRARVGYFALRSFLWWQEKLHMTICSCYVNCKENFINKKRWDMFFSAAFSNYWCDLLAIFATSWYNVILCAWNKLIPGSFFTPTIYIPVGKTEFLPFFFYFCGVNMFECQHIVWY